MPARCLSLPLKPTAAPPEPTLRQLRIFEAAADAGSFSRAGDLLGMTQSAVSQQLRQLQDELGVRLFDTTTRPAQLTASGQELLRHARSILAQVGVAIDALGSVAGQVHGQLHLGVISPAYYFAPRLLAAFSERSPEVNLKLTVGRRDDLLLQLAEHRIDLLFAGYPPAHAEVDAEPFARHPHCLVASANHPLAAQRGLQWSDLRRHPFVFREPGSSTRQFLEHLLHVQGLQVARSIVLQNNETVKQAVVAGMGISFLSAHVFQAELRTGQLVVLDVEGMPKWLDWCVLHRRDLPLTPISQAFREFVLSQGAGLIECDMGR